MIKNKNPYLKCKSFKELFEGQPIVSFESIHFGYPFGDCVVNESQIILNSDKSKLVKLVSVNEDISNYRHLIPEGKEYIFVKMNSILDKGYVDFLVPKENVVYLDE